MMNEEELRLECMRIAINIHTQRPNHAVGTTPGKGDSNSIIETAKKIYKFAEGETK